MQMKRVLAIVALVLLVGGCENYDRGTKETGGTILGGIGGALLGSQIGGGSGKIAATAAGTLLGAWIGNEVGRSLDRADQLEAEQTAVRALERNPDGQRSTWQNPNTGASGYTEPVRTYETAGGTPCREYQTTVIIDGRSETATGTACRQSDGTWRIAS
ncbi:RT0821/Lpp0805 family surface protein [Virgifigura deserti]|uniref:RT0821/Lpp0805 family surface protein n=1 Tax=Virgifigura deserti TaxID=2268457 RepID=UPI003CCC24F1